MDCSGLRVFQIFFHLSDKHLRNVIRLAVLLGNIPDLHPAVLIVPVLFVGDGQILGAVELLADDAAAKGETIEAHHQVQHGGPVCGPDHLGIFPLGENFLGKVGGGLVSLLKAQAGIILKLLHRDRGVLCQGVASPEVDIGAALDERMEFQPVFRQHLVQHHSVVPGPEENADGTAALGHIVDHVHSPGFPDGILKPAGVKLPGGIHEGLRHEGVVLGGDTENALFGPQILLLHELVLLVDLPGVMEEPPPLVGQSHASVRPVEDGNGQLRFQLLNGPGQGGLSHIELFRRPVHRAGFGNGQAVADLLKGHFDSFTALKACSRSSRMSSICSVPIDSRMVFW